MTELNSPTTPAAQSTAATTDAALFDLTGRAQLELSGQDRQSFLHNFCTNDVNRLQPGEGCEAFLTNVKGRILGHIIVSATDEALWIDSVPGSNEPIAAHLDKYLITENVEIVDCTSQLGLLCLIGPRSADWLSEQTGENVELPVWGQHPVSEQGRLDLFGNEVIVRRVAFTGHLGYELVIGHELRESLLERIQSTGVVLGSPDVFEALRIEAGFPHYGIDLTDANIAQEAGRTQQAISFIKGCYLGQEPIARLDALGHTNKELRPLTLASGPVPDPGTSVTSTDGEAVGSITSAALSPARDQPVALAMLKTKSFAAGTDLFVGDTPATIISPDASGQTFC